MKALGASPSPTRRFEFAAFLKKDYERWARVIKTSGVEGRMSAASGLRGAGGGSMPRRSLLSRSHSASARVLRAWNIEDLRSGSQKAVPRAIIRFLRRRGRGRATLAVQSRRISSACASPENARGGRTHRHLGLDPRRDARHADCGSGRGGIGFGWPFADVGVARAQRRPEIRIRSRTWRRPRSSASRARRAGGLWFQAYVFKKRRDHPAADRAARPARLRRADGHRWTCRRRQRERDFRKRLT